MTIRAAEEITLVRVNDGTDGVKVYDGTAGSVVTVSDASEYPALELVADIIPIQPNDYSSVWIAGAGKNLLDPTPAAIDTNKGVTFTYNDDGSYTISGTATSNAYVYLKNKASGWRLPAGTYTFSAKDADGNTVANLRLRPYHWYEDSGGAYYASASTGSVTFTHDGTGFIQLTFEVLSGKTCTGTVWPQCESGSTATAWTPCENICPISGHDDVEISVVGKNLFDGVSTLNGFINTNTGVIASNANARTVYVPCEPNTAYTISKRQGARFVVAETDTLPSLNGSVSNVKSNSTATSITLTTTATARYIVAFVYLSTADTGITADEMLATVQVELGSTATPYEPYNSDTYTTPLGQTVYGGTLDVVEGTLTVTYALMTFDGTQTFTDRISAQNRVWLQLGGMASQSGLNDDMVLCNALPKATGVQNADHPCIAVGVNNAYVYIQGVTHITGVTNLATLNTWLSNNPITFTYKLATPIVYSVSPKEIELLNGTNNVWATTGDITDFRYAEISPATLETFGDARKIAVKYVTDMGDDGIIVHPENDTSNYAKINAEGMDIVKNDESTAFYGDYARVGSENSSRIMIYPTDISMLNQDGAETFRVKTLDKTRSRKVYRNIGYWVNALGTGNLDIADIMAEIPSASYFYLYVTANGSPEATELQFQKGTTATKTASYGGGSVSITYNGTTDIFAVDNTSSSDISTILAIAWVKSATWSRVEVDQIPLDYVVDQGHNTDGWDYVLFASGRAEAWLTVTWTGTLSTSNGGWYSTNESDGIATANMPSEIFVTANNSQPIYRDVTAYQDMYGLSSAKANVTPVLYNVENTYSNRYFGDVQLMRGNSYSTSRTYVINCHVMIPAKSNWQDYI